jgi:hypothetical protein
MKTMSHDSQKIEEQPAAQSTLADSDKPADAYSRDVFMQVPLQKGYQ